MELMTIEHKLDELYRKIECLEKENEELKKRQVDINTAKELYLKIFEEFPALIWRSRTDKLCDYFNKTWLDFTGRTMEQEFGNGWAEGVHPDDLNPCIETYVTSFDNHEAFSMEYRMLNKYGQYRWIRDMGRPFYDLDNTFMGYIGSCYDITDNKNNETMLIELNATKDKFFSIIAHDLRNPFNNILGYTENLKNIPPESFNHENMARITNLLFHSTESAYNLLENLLEWASSQTGNMQFSPQPINLGALFNDQIIQLGDLACIKGISLLSQITTDIVINADKRMMETILRNLITNSIKYTNAEGKIILDAKEKDARIIITVQDTGVGMSPNVAQKLFKIGENSSTPGTLKEKGSGLGLILCREFTERHEGTIYAESEEGKGSTFVISLPQ